MTDRIKAWHFIKEDRKLRDGNTVGPGYIYSVDGPLVMCEWGLHASVEPLDALAYAPGPVVCRVEQWGDVQHQKDKLVSRNREVLWVADASRTLLEFACWCVRHTTLSDGRKVWDLLADERSRHAVVVSERHIRGEATDEELAAAWEAARAASAAAWEAARAASAAAWAARAALAAGDAARDAAWAAGDAARAASAAAWEAALAAGDAARDAAWAAGDAALAAQNNQLTTMLEALGADHD